MRTVCGSEFQTVCAEDRKAPLEKSVLNGFSSSGIWQLHVKFGCKRVLFCFVMLDGLRKLE